MRLLTSGGLVPDFDVVILGAGAAGLLCAIEAGRRGRRVLLLDHADRPGKKILISGGGRSNFTNLHCSPENFISSNPHFAKSALARFTPADMIARVEEHSIPYHEKTLGQLFCDRSSRDLLSMLEQECGQANVLLQLGVSIHSVRKVQDREHTGFTLETSAGHFQAQSVVVATGGLSIPKLGATSFGYDLAQHFGLRVIECRPALVPFTFDDEDRTAWCDLAGVSTETVARVSSHDSAPTGRRSSFGSAASFREKCLLTHRGLSGPAILQISSYWLPSRQLALDLAPGIDVFAPMLERHARRDAAAALQALRSVLPARWAERWLELQLPQITARHPAIVDLPNAAILALEALLHAWQFTPAGTEGYAKAEVTVGGVDTAELNPQTMESRKVPGLFFIGEVVDVTGWLGGFNFQWAWASGFCAGQKA